MLVAEFERYARLLEVRPRQKQTLHDGHLLFADAYHVGHPNPSINGLIVPGWKTMWALDRDGVDYYE